MTFRATQQFIILLNSNLNTILKRNTWLQKYSTVKHDLESTGMMKKIWKNNEVLNKCISVFLIL